MLLRLCRRVTLAGFGKDLLFTARSFWQGRVGADMYVPEGHTLMEAPRCMLLVRATRPELKNGTKLKQKTTSVRTAVMPFHGCLDLELFGAG